MYVNTNADEDLLNTTRRVWSHVETSTLMTNIMQEFRDMILWHDFVTYFRSKLLLHNGEIHFQILGYYLGFENPIYEEKPLAGPSGPEREKLSSDKY